VAELFARLQAALANRYTIERELGRGGMATVFLGQDLKHDRPVAVKVLRPELAAALGPERFLREIKLAARLTHPHILPLHDSGEADGFLFYVMPYVEGESLRDRLTRERQLPVEDAVRIAREVADALGFAHSHDVIHRDIKPENVLLEAGHAVVADFGIARAITAAGGDRLTETGLAVGTPSYMSPEQAAGSRELDGRSDLYSLACVMYEMLAGEPPFTGPTVESVVRQHLTAEAPPVTTVRPGTPPGVALALQRALAKTPADRHPTAAAFAEALAAPTPEATSAPAGATAPGLARVLALYLSASGAVLALVFGAMLALGLPDWFFPGAVVLLLLGLPIMIATGLVQAGHAPARQLLAPVRHWLTWRRAVMGGVLAFAGLGIAVTSYVVMRALGIGPVGSLVAAGVIDPRERIIIADFASHGGDSLLGGVVTEALRIDLAQSPLVNLAQPEYVRQALVRMERPTNTPLDLALAREVAIREGLKAVIAGDIGTAGTSFVLSARLASAETGDVLVAFRETAADSTRILKAIDRLSKRLRERIGESLKTIRANQPLDRVTTPSLAALKKYSQAIRVSDIEGDFSKTTALLEEAIALDTGFAMAHRRLGVELSNELQQRTRAVAALTRAFEHRDRLTDRERYLTIGAYYLQANYQPDKAITAYQSLLDVYPNDGWALNNLGVAYEWLHDYARAEQYYLRSAAVDSFNTAALANVVDVQFALGKRDSARATLERATTKFPGNPGVQVEAARLASARGDYDSAEATIRALKNARRGSGFLQATTSGQLAALATLRGRLGEAGQHLRDAMTAESHPSATDYLTRAIQLATPEVVLRGAPARGLRIVEDALSRHPLAAIDPLERPYLQLADLYALAGRPDRAAAVLAELEQAVAPDLRRFYEPFRQGALGRVALARGNHREAIAALRQAAEGVCDLCPLPLLGRAYELAGEADSAMTVYERYVTTPSTYRLIGPGPIIGTDAYYLAGTYQRLGELYEKGGRQDKAIDYYGRFVNLWRDADLELQPRVADARRRIARLSREPR
jgi:eukaryotic-like serine/threonine-protein kinase